jgi:hypothetical protein
MTDHEIAAAAAETGIRADVLAGYIEEGATIAEAVEAERGRAGRADWLGKGCVLIETKKMRKPFNGRDYLAEVVLVRDFTGAETNDIISTCSRAGHTRDEALGLCIAAVTESYRGYSWRHVIADDHICLSCKCALDAPGTSCRTCALARCAPVPKCIMRLEVETEPAPRGGFVAMMGGGTPAMYMGRATTASTREAAFAARCAALRQRFPRVTFEFTHAQIGAEVGA